MFCDIILQKSLGCAMFCKKCGKKIDDDSVFCSYCGEKLVLDLQEEKSPKALEQAPLQASLEKRNRCSESGADGI